MFEQFFRRHSGAVVDGPFELLLAHQWRNQARIVRRLEGWRGRGGYQALENGGCGAASATFDLEEGALSGFRLEIQCSESTHNERGDTITVYEITVVAERGQYGRPDYVKREKRAQFTGGG
jgi:hypothetical protein